LFHILISKGELKMPLYGYARVSTRDQDLALQLNELTAAGCAKVFKEKASGARSDRPELAKVIGRLEPGDVLVVTRLDRLARSTRDLLNVLDELAKRGAGFRSLKDSWADTTTPHGKLMVTVLGGLAEFERELIRARTGEGRKRAKESGVRFGRPHKLTPHSAPRRCSASPRARRRPTLPGCSTSARPLLAAWLLPALSSTAWPPASGEAVSGGDDSGTTPCRPYATQGCRKTPRVASDSPRPGKANP
jgi:DNA invertase Pin-like site-specific DNA recombinase